MFKIEFIPEEFGSVLCDFGRYSAHPCTPAPESGEPMVVNTLRIDAPKEIVCYIDRDKGQINELSTGLRVPICMYTVISLRRAAKYFELCDWIVNVKEIGGERCYSAILKEDCEEPEAPLPIELRKEIELERAQNIKQAQEYSDSELNIGGAVINSMNFDLHKYVNAVVEGGEYEVYISKFGLESNRVVVKITCKDSDATCRNMSY